MPDLRSMETITKTREKAWFRSEHARCRRMRDVSIWKAGNDSEWFPSQVQAWCTMLCRIRRRTTSKYTQNLQPCQFRCGGYAMSNRGIGSLPDQSLHHSCQAWSDVLDTFQTLHTHLAVDQVQVLRRILDGPGRLPVGPHATTGLTVQIHAVELIGQRLDNQLVEGALAAKRPCVGSARISPRRTRPWLDESEPETRSKQDKPGPFRVNLRPSSPAA